MKSPLLLVPALFLTLLGCGAPATDRPADTPVDPAKEWAIAVHGGAGVGPESLDPEQREARTASLREALSIGSSLLDDQTHVLDQFVELARSAKVDAVVIADLDVAARTGHRGHSRAGRSATGGIHGHDRVAIAGSARGTERAGRGSASGEPDQQRRQF